MIGYRLCSVRVFRKNVFFGRQVYILRNGTSLLPKYTANSLVEESSKILQVRFYAARKGTREKKKKAKVKVEVEKVGFIPHNQRVKDQGLLHRQPKIIDDSWKKDPLDNVFVTKYYKWIVYPFQQAVECHRETHHPEMYNKPNAELRVSIDLNMEGEKKNRFIDGFTRIAAVPHKYDHGEERTVIAFSKTPELQKEAIDAGAQLSGGVELIKQIQNGQISLQDFQFTVADPEILPELVVLRGLMKRRFPNPRSGTLDTNLRAMVERFMHGISYTASADGYQKEYGLIETVIGTYQGNIKFQLDMDVKHLEENFAALVRDIHSAKPKRDGDFILRCLLWSPPSPEKLKVDHKLYLDVQKEESKSLEEDEETGERIAL
ncbi:hypothetical protein NQ318_000382 [Aromia moschata]|uniref:39S ribosomal protein L1, mitochondrial n=1 Tax=Aromia moschata TaxID=1265417 RepID=A0AAV8YTX0_9CUCU|nr:hypothetical protein NQ318_000382 [Aromia moschata]